MSTHSYTINQLIGDMKQKIVTLGRIPTRAEVTSDPCMACAGTYLGIWPDWESVIATTGFTMSWCSPQYRQHLLDDLWRKYAESDYRRLPGTHAIQNDPTLASVPIYVQIFGDIRCAQVVAGIYQDYLARQRQRIIAILQDLHRQTGTIPKVKDPGVPNDKLIRKVFGSFPEALIAAGLRANRRYWTKDQVVKKLRWKHQQLGHSPTTTEIAEDPTMPSNETICKLFGNHANALQAAKLPPVIVDRSSYTREELIKQLQHKSAELGGYAPTAREVTIDPHMASVSAFCHKFGSFEAALNIAEINIKRSQADYAREKLIEQLQRKATELGRAPMRREVDQDPNMAASSTFKREFKSFNAALQAANLKPSRTYYDDQTLIELLANKHLELGTPPTNEQIDRDPDMPCARTYCKRFGGIQNAHYLVEEYLDQLA